MNKLFFQPLIFVFITSCASIPHKSLERKAQLEAEIREKVTFLGEAESFSSIENKMLAYNIPALSLAVIHQGEIEWADVYQNANFSDEQKLDASSIFQAASTCLES